MIKSAILFLLLSYCVFANAQEWTENEIKTLQRFSLNTIKSIPDPSNKYLNHPQAISLGKALFNDKRLSSNGEVSCSSCHIEQYSFTDNRKLPLGLREGFRNTSSLLNIANQHWFFADGAKDSLWSQALSSIENPAEQNFTRTEVLKLISNDMSYRNQYENIFQKDFFQKIDIKTLPEKAGPNAKLQDLKAWKKLNKSQKHQINTVFTDIGKAIAAYVTTINSRESRFDKFIDELSINPQSKMLNESEQRGLKLFLSQESGCANCHSGPLFSNKTFHDIATGIPGKDNGRSEVIESVVRDEFNCLGKYSDAKPEECFELNYINRDKHQLKGTYRTSMLRNIRKTAPYMHDGRFKDLTEVINHYVVTSQDKKIKSDLIPITLNKAQQRDLVNLLKAL